MDDLEANPFYQAFMTKFQREFRNACKMSCTIAIPHSESMENVDFDHVLANSHILMPSKLLKHHYTPLQVGFSDDIEIDGKRLIVYLGKKEPIVAVTVNILGEEIGYNVHNKEYRVILIDRPLISLKSKPLFKSIFSPILPPAVRSCRKTTKLPKHLLDHEDCSRYLDEISQQVTMDLELEVERLQSNYLILSDYLDDAARRIKDLAGTYIPKYESLLEVEDGETLCDNAKRALAVAVENYVVSLLHGKLTVSIQSRHEKEDRAGKAFTEFNLCDKLTSELKNLPNLHSPLAVANSLVKAAELIRENLEQSVRSNILMGLGTGSDGDKVAVCSDDLIASFVYSLAQVRPCRLYSLCKYLETFGWTSGAKEQAAYYIATFHVVIQYALSR